MNRIVNKQEVIQAAEDFISGPDYTDQCVAKALAFVFEAGEESEAPQEISKRRRDTLERKAYAVFRWQKEQAVYWTVVFRYRPRLGAQYEGLGRAVTLEEKPWGDLWEPHLERVDVKLATLGADSLV